MKTKPHMTRWEAVENYALADKSDPFALARIRTHMRNGIASLRNDEKPDDNPYGVAIDAFYSATPAKETRFLPARDGRPETPYTATVYRHMVRP